MLDTQKLACEIGNSNILYELSDDERNKLKNCLLEMYKDFERVCNKYSLDFMLGGGSALGAIRHKGFIPWDDDLDIMMPREDYNKFCKIFSEEMSEQYYLYAPNSGFGITNTFAKIVKKNTKVVDIYNVNIPYYKGVWVDIFPIENVSKNRIVKTTKGFLADMLAFIVVSNYIYTFRNSIMKRYFYSNKKSKKIYKLRLMIGFLTSLINYKRWYNFYDKFVQQKKSSDIWTIPTGRKHYIGEALTKECFVPTKKGTFENVSVNLPNDPDTYLRNLYGDYMSIPPEGKRERHLFIEFIV